MAQVAALDNAIALRDAASAKAASLKGQVSRRLVRGNEQVMDIVLRPAPPFPPAFSVMVVTLSVEQLKQGG